MFAARGCDVSDASGAVVGRLERHATVHVVEVDGDGNDLRCDACSVWIARPLAGRVPAAALRTPDGLDALVHRADTAHRRTFARLASALRTDNAVKLKLLLEKARADAGDCSGDALFALCARRLHTHVLRTACRQAATCYKVDVLADVVRMLDAAQSDVEDHEALVAQVRRRGAALVKVRAVLGDPDDVSHQRGRGACVHPAFVASALQQAEAHDFDASLVNALRRRLDACERAAPLDIMQPCADGGNEATVVHDDVVIHSVFVESASDPRLHGEFTRLVRARGRIRSTPATPDDACEGFNSYYERGGAAVYFHACDRTVQLRLEGGGWTFVLTKGCLDAEGLVHHVHAVDRDALALEVCAAAPKDPAAAAWRSPLRLASCTVSRLCIARKLEANAYFALMTFADAVVADGLYTDAIEAAFDDARVPTRLRVDLLLNRAENKVSRLDALRPRGEPSFIKSALRDVDEALLLAQVGDVRPLLKRARIRIALYDFDAAAADIAAAVDLRPGDATVLRCAAALRKEAARKRASSKAV